MKYETSDYESFRVLKGLKNSKDKDYRFLGPNCTIVQKSVNDSAGLVLFAITNRDDGAVPNAKFCIYTKQYNRWIKLQKEFISMTKAKEVAFALMTLFTSVAIVQKDKLKEWSEEITGEDNMEITGEI